MISNKNDGDDEVATLTWRCFDLGDGLTVACREARESRHWAPTPLISLCSSLPKIKEMNQISNTHQSLMTNERSNRTEQFQPLFKQTCIISLNSFVIHASEYVVTLHVFSFLESTSTLWVIFDAKEWLLPERRSVGQWWYLGPPLFASQVFSYGWCEGWSGHV